MIKLHNSFTANGETFFNTVYDVVTPISHREDYSAYIIVYTESGKQIAIATELTAYNYDPRTTVYVEKTAYIEESIEDVIGMACSSDGVTKTTYADVSGIKLTAPTNIIVRLYLEFNGNNVQPVALDHNPFLAWLLGQYDEVYRFSMALGTDAQRMSCPAKVPNGDYYAITDEEIYPEFEYNTITFKATFPYKHVTELILLANDEPVFRAWIPDIMVRGMYAPGFVATGNCVNIKTLFGTSVSAVTCNGTIVNGTEVDYLYDSMGEPIYLPELAPQHPTLFCDSYNKYLGLAGGGEIMVFTDFNGWPQLCMNIACSTTVVDVTNEGEVVLYDGKGKIRVYYPNGKELCFEHEPCDRIVAVNEAGNIHIAVLCGYKLIRYVVRRDYLSFIEEAEDIYVLLKTDIRIAYGSSRVGKVVTISGKNSVLGETLKKFIDNYGMEQTDSGVVFNGESLLDLATCRISQQEAGGQLTGSILMNNGNIYIRDFSEQGYSHVGFINNEPDAIGRLGNNIIIVESGNLMYCAPLKKCGITVRSDGISDGGIVNMYVLTGCALFNEGSDCNYSINFEFN